MEKLGSFPDLPVEYSQSKIISFYGEHRLITSSVSELLNLSAEIDEGFNFYSSGKLLLATFTTNNQTVQTLLFGLKKLQKFSDNIIYLIPNISFHNPLLSEFSLSKLCFFSFANFVKPLETTEKQLEVFNHVGKTFDIYQH